MTMENLKFIDGTKKILSFTMPGTNTIIDYKYDSDSLKVYFVCNNTTNYSYSSIASIFNNIFMDNYNEYNTLLTNLSSYYSNYIENSISMDEDADEDAESSVWM